MKVQYHTQKHSDINVCRSENPFRLVPQENCQIFLQILKPQLKKTSFHSSLSYLFFLSIRFSYSFLLNSQNMVFPCID